MSSLRMASIATLALAFTVGPKNGMAETLGLPHDFGGEARAVFSAKCTGCHGPDLTKPKARFGYVLDLARIAENPEMVIPGQPDESELWQLVRRGEMPPDDSPRGPLTPGQKEAVRQWIAAGGAGAPVRETVVREWRRETANNRFCRGPTYSDCLYRESFAAERRRFATYYWRNSADHVVRANCSRARKVSLIARSLPDRADIGGGIG